MFGSAILDVAIGMVFVFALVSVVCTAIREVIEAWLKTRAAYLEQGIRQLLDDVPGKGLARQLYEHPLINGLYSGSYQSTGSKRTRILASGGALPSYIPAGNFAAALLELAARGPAPLSASKSTPPLLTLENVRAGVAGIENEAVQRALLTAVDSAQGSLDQARRNLEAWYDSAMDRVSGWYKRSTHWIVFWSALAVAGAMNVDTVAIIKYLHRHEAARDAVVARAQAASTGGSYEEAKKALADLQLPIGWARDESPDRSGWPTRVLGWLLTAFAATLGAPFWFDMLNKLMVIRSTVKPREKSGEEGSEDRQPKVSAAPAPVAPVSAPAPVPSPAPAAGPAPAAPAPIPAPPPAALAVAVPVPADACDIPITDTTPDAQLPAASGGVA